jgi:anti-sigma factor (TIGR02949 family)
LPSCKEFLEELSEFLDDTVDPGLKQRLQEHMNECPNCYVIVDTTRRTLAVYRGGGEQPVPEEVRRRVWSVLDKKMAARAKKAL